MSGLWLFSHQTLLPVTKFFETMNTSPTSSPTSTWTYENFSPTSRSNKTSLVSVRSQGTGYFSVMKISKDTSETYHSSVTISEAIAVVPPTELAKKTNLSPTQNGPTGISKPLRTMTNRPIRTKITIAELLN